MKQKTRFKNFGNIGIGLKKAISVDLCSENYFWYCSPQIYIKQGLHLCKNIIYPEWKHLWVRPLWSMLVLKFALIFLRIWSMSHLIHLENNTKKLCYLAKCPIVFHFICLSFFCNIFSAPFFPYTSPIAHPTTVHKHASAPLFFRLLITGLSTHYQTPFSILFQY